MISNKMDLLNKVSGLSGQKKKFPVYLVLLLVFYLFHNYNQIFGFIPFTQILYYLIFCFSAVLCYWLIYFFYKSSQKAGVLAFLLSAFFLFFGQYHDFLKIALSGSFLSSYKVVVPFSLLFIFLLWGYLNKRPNALSRFSQYLHVLMMVLCVIETFLLLYNGSRFLKDKNLIYPEFSICNKYTSSNIPDSLKPDIYYMVFDEYTNNKTLQEIWGFDNSDISNWLTSRDFYNIPESNSNYTLTPFSISSTLNMNYLPRETGEIGTARNYLLANRSISTNETFCLLKKESYTIRFIAPFSNAIEQNEIRPFFDELFERQLSASTFWGRFRKDVYWNFQKTGKISKDPPQGDQRKAEEVAFTVKKIKSTTDSLVNRKPKFVYGHFMITHEPHVFDSTGKILTGNNSMPKQEAFFTYTQQVLYANRIIKELVDYIRSNNKKKTIIIIQGDHGYSKHQPSRLRYYFPIFNAIYFPDKNYDQFYKTMSPINTFRILFNQYFYQKLEVLKDSSIIVKQL